MTLPSKFYAAQKKNYTQQQKNYFNEESKCLGHHLHIQILWILHKILPVSVGVFL